MHEISDDIAEALRLNSQIQAPCLDRHRAADLIAQRPNLLADTQIFLAARWHRVMADAVAAIERVVALAGWQQRVLAGAGLAAQHPTAVKGVFFGYDFHITEQGPKLIEINTNAGGAFINLSLIRCQNAATGLPEPDQIEQDFLAMFRQEWALADQGRPLMRVAIVDESPESQYLNPDFEICRLMLEQAGIAAVICDPAELSHEQGQLLHQGQRVDLVYNRLTDFALDQASQAVLRQAWLAGDVVLTPHPRAHALFSDKHNLVLLADRDWLISIGASAVDIDRIQAVLLKSELVRADQGEELWARRKSLFFKPVTGYGGKAVYRGLNVTRGVFVNILAGDYIAQELAPPPLRTVLVEATPMELKYDLRCYTYAGHIQLMAARLWQGQTTNFRTPGGGFAPVVIV